MAGSKATDHHLLHLMDGDDGALQLEPPSSPVSGVSCSICLDLVADDGERSRAKLRCGHEFHLDCIGSAFNMKGAMQCPNCRKVEKGRWLYANGSACSLPEFSMEDWIPDEDIYDLSYAEMPFRVHWCPYGRLARLRSSFEEMEFPSTTYNGLPGHHAVFAEQTAASPVAHSYVAYFRPIPPASSNSADSVDDLNPNHHWNGLPGHTEIFDPQTFSAINNRYPNWVHHAPVFPTSGGHINAADPASVTPATQRSTRSESDVLTNRSRSFAHPFIFGHGSGPVAGSSFVSSIVPHHPSGIARAHERMQVSHAFHHQQQPNNSHSVPSPAIPGIRRLDGHRGMPAVVPAPPQPDHNSNFYVFPPSSSNLHEAENALPNHAHIWERERLSHFPAATYDQDSGWQSFHQTNTSGTDPGNRPSNFWHRHWLWRT